MIQAVIIGVEVAAVVGAAVLIFIMAFHEDR